MVYFELGKSMNGDGCFRVQRNAKYKKDISAFVKNNSHENLYMTVYTFTEMSDNKPIYDSAICDRMFFEIDSANHSLIDDFAFAEIRKLIEWCKSEQFEGGEIRPQIFFSGRSGYHVVFTFEKPLQALKDGRVIKHLVKQLKIKTGTDIDLQANNGHSQMRRIPNTLNHKSGYYCIPLTIDEAYNYSPDRILQLAKKPRKALNNFEGPSPYFTEVVSHIKTKFLKTISTQMRTRDHVDPANSTYENIRDIRNRKRVRPCIGEMLKQQNPTFQERTFIACELIRCGFNDIDIHRVFRAFNKYQQDITQRHLDKIRSKGLFAPSCSTLELQGACNPGLHTRHAEREFNDSTKKDFFK